jgi:hypothetical protein
MTASIGGGPFGSCAGRAVSIRRCDAVSDPGTMLREAGRGGATILIASPASWSWPERATAIVARCGFRVVISAGFSEIHRHKLINAGILPVALPAETIAKLQDAVESDPGIVLTVDVDSGDVRAREELPARFEIGQGPGPRPTQPADTSDIRGHGSEAMARQLLLAHRLLCSARLSGDVRMRLQRSLVAICDAMKAPGADAGRSARRLERLLTELAMVGQAGSAQVTDGREQTPASGAQARNLGARGGATRARRRP